MSHGHSFRQYIFCQYRQVISHQHLSCRLQELLIFPDYITKMVIVVSLNKYTSSKSRSIFIYIHEKNRNTIQLLPENVDVFRHLTQNISAISIAIRISWVCHTQEINYIVGLTSLHSHVQGCSLTHRHCPYYSFPPIIATVCSSVCRE